MVKVLQESFCEYVKFWIACIFSVILLPSSGIQCKGQLVSVAESLVEVSSSSAYFVHCLRALYRPLYIDNCIKVLACDLFGDGFQMWHN